MTKLKLIAVTTTLALMAAPTAAFAHCGGSTSSFSVSCESGVKVMRHHAKSAMPIGLTPAQAQIKQAKIQQKIASQRIAAQERIAMRQADLRAQEISNDRYRNQLLERNTRNFTTTIDRRGFGFGRAGFGFNGYGQTFAQPLVVRKAH